MCLLMCKKDMFLMSCIFSVGRVENVRLFLPVDEAHDGKLSSRRHNDGRSLRQDAPSDSGFIIIVVVLSYICLKWQLTNCNF